MSKGSAQTSPRIRFKSYPSYKYSGVEWLGEIPTDWSVRRLKTLISEPITDGPHETPDFLTDGVPFLSVDGIQEGELVFEGCRYISEAAHREYRTKCAPRREDILLGKAASTGKIARVKVDFEFGVWSPLALIRPNEAEVWPSFLEYALKSMATQAQIDVLCTSSTQKNISMQDIPILVVCLAGLQQQRTIATFLDQETAKIDKLIAKKDRLIELLQEKRNALITQAVTKGLDPTVPMKDSGVGWFGNMPAHWEIAPLKRYILPVPGAIKTGPFGSQLLSSEMESGDIKVYNQRTAIDRDFDAGDNFISEDKFRQLASFAVQPRDILVTTRGTIGRCAIVPDSADKGILHPCLMRIQLDPSKVLREFAILLIQDSDLVRTQLALASNATTIDVIYSETMCEVFVPKPPIDEQRTIIAAVNRETGKIDRLVAKVRDGIDRLKECRTALISAAVTGKIDVRGEVA